MIEFTDYKPKLSTLSIGINEHLAKEGVGDDQIISIETVCPIGSQMGFMGNETTFRIWYKKK
jgi:hypothetical protein